MQFSSNEMLFAKALRYWRLNGTRSLLSRILLEFKRRRGRRTIKSSLNVGIKRPVKVERLIQSKFPNLSPLRIFTAPSTGRRVNIVTDSINAGSIFGGVGTAMILGVLFAESSNASLRIITRTEVAQPANFREVICRNNVSYSRNVEFGFAGVDSSKPIDIHAEDIFITTSWWTTEALRGAVRSSQIIYLMQEDERMFYPHGDEYFRCCELLSRTDIQLVINSKMLFDYLAKNGMQHLCNNGIYFEPAFPDSLFYREAKSGGRNRFMFYARPNNLRNLFYLGVEAINEAINSDILSPDAWDFIFVGKDIPRVELCRSVVPQISENLAWGDYASLIRGTDLGLALMYTPHPSYPPLDIAASGGIAVTNKYASKTNLANYSGNIICADLSLRGLVQALGEGARRANDMTARQSGYGSNKMQRDWRVALAPSIAKFEGMWPNVLR